MAFNVRQDKNVKSLDEGITITDNTMSIDYVGAGVVATATGNNTTVTISGGGTSSPASVPTGTINGSNTVFTLANTPIVGTERVYLGGARQQGGGGDYTISGATITFNIAPPTGIILIVDYSY